jgi:two-component system, chemotaxis family, sensor kinase CheA
MSTLRDRSLISIEDVYFVACEVTLEDSETLNRILDRLIFFINSKFLESDVIDCLCNAKEGLEGLFEGSVVDTEMVLHSIIQNLKCAVEIAKGETAAMVSDSVRAPVPEIPVITEPARPIISDPEPPAFHGLPCLTREDIMGPEPEVSEESAVPDAAMNPPEPVEPEAERITSFELSSDLDPDLLNEYIIESLDHLDISEAAMLDIESEPDDLDAINNIFRAFHTIKGTSGFLGLPHIQEMAHLAETLLSSARDGELKLVGGYADLILESCDVIKSLVKILDGAAPGSTLPVANEFYPLLLKLKNPKDGVSETPAVPRVGDIPVAEGVAQRDSAESVAEQTDGRRIGEAKVKDVAQAQRTQNSIKKAQAADATIRVATGRLDSLIDMVGELVIAQSLVSQDPNVAAGTSPRLTKNVAHASKIVRELQDLTMGLRMVPLKGIFQKMTRLVRDLGRKSEKKVRFVSSGEETELDRNMVEALSDPLVHMIRNSVDHGLESTSDRLTTGKPEVGTVTLRAYQSAGNVMIELADDGKGLDREKIIAKAIKNGLISDNANLSDTEVYNMIFAPGFSTAETVTDVSGRGVGMDVVRKRIDSLRGKVDIQSEFGKGTIITLSLPLTMAITDSMIVKIGEERYLLPTISIEQSIRPDSKSLFTVTGRGEMILLRGDLIPVVRLNRLFGFSDGVRELDDGLLICVEAEGKRCALMVDALLGQQQVVVKALGDWLGEIPGVSGGTILGDGRVGLILDVASLLKIANAGAETKASVGEIGRIKKTNEKSKSEKVTAAG